MCKCSNMESVEDIIRDHFTDLGLLLKTEVLADTSSMDNDSKASHLLSNNEIQGDLDISVDADDLLVVVNKCDLIEDSDLGSIQRLLQENKHFSACCISCTSGQGIEEFLEILQQRLRTM